MHSAILFLNVCFYKRASILKETTSALTSRKMYAIPNNGSTGHYRDNLEVHGRPMQPATNYFNTSHHEPAVLAPGLHPRQDAYITPQTSVPVGPTQLMVRPETTGTFHHNGYSDNMGLSRMVHHREQHNIIPVPTNYKSENDNAAAWEERFRALCKFKSEFGHCMVPARYPTDRQLGHWVMTQRRQYHLLVKGKLSSMVPARIEKLNSLGFVWSVRTDHDEMWGLRFEELKIFKEKHADCLVPQRYPPNPPLGTW